LLLVAFVLADFSGFDVKPVKNVFLVLLPKADLPVDLPSDRITSLPVHLLISVTK
jgi:hypothetical protein